MSEKSDIGFAEGMNTLWLSVEPVPEHFLYMQCHTVYTAYMYMLYVYICYYSPIIYHGIEEVIYTP